MVNPNMPNIINANSMSSPIYSLIVFYYHNLLNVRGLQKYPDWNLYSKNYLNQTPGNLDLDKPWCTVGLLLNENP